MVEGGHFPLELQLVSFWLALLKSRHIWVNVSSVSKI